MNSNFFKLILRLVGVKYGKGLLLRGIPTVYRKRGARIALGDGVIIKSSFLSNLVGLYSRTILCARTSGAEIVIGNNVGMSGATLYARKGIHIGDNTCIGGNCKILDNDFHPLEWVERNRLMRGAHGPDVNERIPTKAIHIGKNCLLGCNSIILKGTVLGDGCVVGAGAVVCGEFAPDSLIVGNPACCVRKIENRQE